MTRAHLLACLAGSVLLTACASAPVPVDISVGRTLAQAQTALALAENGADTAYRTGVIDKPTIRRVAALADKVDAVSITARCAYAANDLATVAGALTALGSIALAITAETSGRPVLPLPAFSTFTCAAPAPVAAVHE